MKERDIYKVSDILEATSGSLLSGDQTDSFRGISTDSRIIQEGDIFLALKGKNHDGHDFVVPALERGVHGVLIQETYWGRLRDSIPSHIVVIGASDSLRALGDIAAFWRKRYPVKAVGITGSNGKTATKETVSSILTRRYRVLKTPGNFNNLIGLPLTLLQLTRFHEICVLEMGTNHFGEIRRLTEIAQPDIGLITNIQMAHTENLGDLDGVMVAKGELFEGMDEHGIAIINSDDKRISQLGTSFKGKRITFGLTAGSDVMAREIKNLGVDGVTFCLVIRGQELKIHVKSPGLHNVHNALAGAAVALALNVETDVIREGLEAFRPLSMRMEVLQMSGGIRVINDAYNANPGSMKVALDTLVDLKNNSRGIVVLGDMLELGDMSASAHYDLGRYIAQSKIDHLMVIGNHADWALKGATEAGMNAQQLFRGWSHEDISSRLKEILKEGDWILVKGSRSMQMEILVEELTEIVKH